MHRRVNHISSSIRGALIILLLAPRFDSSVEFPKCTQERFSISLEANARINVGAYREVGAIAENCENSDCRSTAIFRTRSTDSCSLVCSKVIRCDWWSATVEFESQHINRTICRLFNERGGNAVPGKPSTDSVSGHKSCSPSLWPGCGYQDAFFAGTGYSELWIDATSLLGGPANDTSCYNDECLLTDRFRVSSVGECTSVCARMPACKFWSVTSPSPEYMICWLRRGKFQTLDSPGAVSGDADCARHAPLP